MPAAFNILVVDDNPTILKLLCQNLEKCGELITATDGADALQEAVEIQPDLIVSDYSMPHTNGMELLESCRLYFNQGQVTHAQCGPLEGNEAVYKVLT